MGVRRRDREAVKSVLSGQEIELQSWAFGRRFIRRSWSVTQLTHLTDGLAGQRDVSRKMGQPISVRQASGSGSSRGPTR